MLTRLSSKGQLVIPRAVRDALGLERGTEFHVRLEGERIVLEPVGPASADTLYGKYAGSELLTDLEAEHRQELDDEAALRA